MSININLNIVRIAYKYHPTLWIIMSAVE